jgi:tetratricopeptide (TPR) repeat protein
MLKSSSQIAALLAAALLAACQGVPKPGPETTLPEAEATVQTNAGDSTAGLAATPAVEPQPKTIDLDQLAYDDAIAALKEGHAESAEILLARLARDGAEKPRLFTNLGLARFRLQQYELAERAFRQALARDADDAVAHNHIGILERRKGQFENALKSYQRAIEIDAKYARAHLNLGILFDLYLQDLEKALQQYRLYQALTNDEDEQVAGWIVDIERRLQTDGKQTQG